MNNSACLVKINWISNSDATPWLEHWPQWPGKVPNQLGCSSLCRRNM